MAAALFLRGRPLFPVPADLGVAFFAAAVDFLGVAAVDASLLRGRPRPRPPDALAVADFLVTLAALGLGFGAAAVAAAAAAIAAVLFVVGSGLVFVAGALPVAVFFLPPDPGGRPRGRPDGTLTCFETPFLGGRPRPRFTGSPVVASAVTAVRSSPDFLGRVGAILVT